MEDEFGGSTRNGFVGTSTVVVNGSVESDFFGSSDSFTETHFDANVVVFAFVESFGDRVNGTELVVTFTKVTDREVSGPTVFEAEDKHFVSGRVRTDLTFDDFDVFDFLGELESVVYANSVSNETLTFAFEGFHVRFLNDLIFTNSDNRHFVFRNLIQFHDCAFA